MAISQFTTAFAPTDDNDSLQCLLAIDRALVQATAVTRLMGAAGPHDTLPPGVLADASWLVSDLLKTVNDAAARLGRIASSKE